jgi:hypothetical protein
MNATEIPPNILRCMSPSDRAFFTGKATSATPTTAKQDAKNGLLPPTPANAPNKTEREALHVLRLHLMDFEGRTFTNPGGGTYTPDWYGNGFAVEVKGEHIFDRGSRPKFDAAKAAHPELTWIWARKRTKGRLGPRWEIQVFPSKAVTT